MKSIKKMGRSVVCRVLEWQVRRLRARHEFIVVAVVGSVGKTSVKLAIAEALSTHKRVVYERGNFNDRVTVPLVLFDQPLPNLLNVLGWIKIFLANEHRIRSKFPYDVAVLELGINGPGQMQKFAYLQPDIAVVTAVSPEHIDKLIDLKTVAREELAVMDFSKLTIVNVDDVASNFLLVKDYISYGLRSGDYRACGVMNGLEGQKVVFKGRLVGTAVVPFLGDQGVKVALAAAAVAHEIGLLERQVLDGLKGLRPFAGRMRLLRGANDATIIDDTYNASPIAVKAGLDVLESIAAPQHIAILGNMNELGEYSRAAHIEVGEYCDPSKASLVVTIGPDANAYLAPAAAEKGCTVQTFDNPYDAGDYVKKYMQPGAVVLAEGSQNGVFAEEAVKKLLANKKDASLLVRQSRNWLRAKRRAFKRSS